MARPKPATSRNTRSEGTARKAPKLTLAQRADRHDCYQRAVQCVEAEIDFVDETYTKLRKRKAVRLREDFCGTANTSCEWVRRRNGNVAIGFDLCRETLDWGLAHNVERLKPSQRERVHLRQTDVLVPHPDLKGTMDIILAMNFSFWIFKKRETMLAYFKRVREDLADDGILFTDFYGGFDAYRCFKERRKVPHASKGEASVFDFNTPFTYIWDQHDFNPITGDMVCKIHFEFPDGSRLRNAFTYEWRLWGLREILDVLEEAGFSKTTVYWEGDDNRGGGNGIFEASTQGEPCAGWIVYISAEK